MVIKSIRETSYPGMFKIAPESGAAFFIRKEYLSEVDFDSIEPEKDFTEEQFNELLDAGFACVVELKAVEYLARAEQSRFGLNRKLLEKKFDKKYITKALDLLEEKNYLSDERYSRAWLNSRRINHYEGKTKLLSELQSRGISKEIAVAAVNEFFEEFDEMEICKKAYEKFVKKGKTDEKLIAAMMQAGFSYKMIKEAATEFSEQGF